jgi:hypothetical protein
MSGEVSGLGGLGLLRRSPYPQAVRLVRAVCSSFKLQARPSAARLSMRGFSAKVRSVIADVGDGARKGTIQLVGQFMTQKHECYLM